jgi:hypothetical protein
MIEMDRCFDRFDNTFLGGICNYSLTPDMQSEKGGIFYLDNIARALGMCNYLLTGHHAKKG